MNKQKMKINLEAIKNSKGYEFADNRHGELCRLVPIEEAQQQDKQLKVLLIVKDKRVDINSLIASDCVNEYNTTNQYGTVTLTQEEYDLLKEAFE